MTQQEFNFEHSFARLEEILDKMNAGGVSLDESLRLYEEADRLITACSKKLNSAEAKIEALIRKRDGELALDEEGQPVRENFQEALT